MKKTYEGKPCKNCNNTKRYKSNRSCTVCIKANFDKWVLENPGKRDMVRQINNSTKRSAVNMRKPWTEEDIKEALRRDRSVTELAKSLNRSYTAVRRIRERYGKKPEYQEYINMTLEMHMSRAKPQRITSATARNRATSALEHYRCRDTKVSREEFLARFGLFLGTLGWKPQDIQIVNVTTELEDDVTQAVRNRMVRPRA